MILGDFVVHIPGVFATDDLQHDHRIGVSVFKFDFVPEHIATNERAE